MTPPLGLAGASLVMAASALSARYLWPVSIGFALTMLFTAHAHVVAALIAVA